MPRGRSRPGASRDALGAASRKQGAGEGLVLLPREWGSGAGAERASRQRVGEALASVPWQCRAAGVGALRRWQTVRRVL